VAASGTEVRKGRRGGERPHTIPLTTEGRKGGRNTEKGGERDRREARKRRYKKNKKINKIKKKRRTGKR
jgi:hypothetical protein